MESDVYQTCAVGDLQFPTRSANHPALHARRPGSAPSAVGRLRSGLQVLPPAAHARLCTSVQRERPWGGSEVRAWGAPEEQPQRLRPCDSWGACRARTFTAASPLPPPNPTLVFALCPFFFATLTGAKAAAFQHAACFLLPSPPGLRSQEHARAR